MSTTIIRVPRRDRFLIIDPRAGLHHMHGLRHAYAQNRYEELTGWKCPAAGGSDSKSLTPEQREIDHEARLTISRELGHEREQVTAAYLGRSAGISDRESGVFRTIITK